MVEYDKDIMFDDTLTLEEDIIEIPKDQRKLTTQAYDKSVSDIVRMIRDGDIHLNPEYQRNYVWDNKRASLLIESIILNVPIPVIYVNQEEDDSWTVIDGLQRLNTLKRFFERDFKLRSLEILDDLNGDDVKSLNPKAARILKNGLLRVIVVSNDSHPDIKYDIFMRLNQGAVKLNEQELRNCLYRGKFNELLKDIRDNEKFMKMLNRQEPHKRMIDSELVLRFLALSHYWIPEEEEIEEYNGRMKKFMNNFMAKQAKIDDNKLSYYRKLFNETVDKVYDIFGEKAFRRINKDGEYETPLNRAIMDCLMLSFTKFDKTVLLEKKNEIIDTLKSLVVVDDDFRESVIKATSDKKVVQFRLNRWYKELNEVING